MSRLVLFVALLALAGCNSASDLPEDPALAVPGVADVNVPPSTPPEDPVPPPPTSFDPPLAVPGVAGPITPPPPMPPGMAPGQMPPGMAPGQVPPGMQPGQVPPGMQPGQVPPGVQPGQMAPAGAPLSLAAGFQPDPQILRGQTMGQNPAANLRPECAGFIPAAPNHVIDATTPFANLRILASSQIDIMLLVQGSDGSIRCNDDSNGSLNPLIEGPMQPGRYMVFVGTYQANTPANYAIGFTEISAVDHTTLGPPP
jgi:hypothetical protein